MSEKPAKNAVVEQMFKGFHRREGTRSVEEARREGLAQATRQFLDAMIHTVAPTHEIDAVTSLVRDAEAVLRKYPHMGNVEPSLTPSAEGSFGVGTSFLDRSPLIGSMNPIAPPLIIDIRQPSEGSTDFGLVSGSVTFGTIYEGPPGCVHGGYIAAAFDEVLGITQSLAGNPGMTGQLTVRYKSPTPLHRELVFEGRIERIEGRKIFTVATLSVGDVLCAEAEGLFISMRPEVFERLLQIRAGELG
jgi:acyl-coenzyme A thioesterase PaaI-like protein